MFVTSVTKIDSRRQKVILDSEYVFSLYNSEIKKYNIEAGCCIEEKIVSSIEHEVLYPRAKERALYILGKSDKTEKQLKDKLNESFYPDVIIDKVINLLKFYGYIDDEKFASSYVKMKKSSKSRRQIEGELIQKGISITDIKSAFEENHDEYELEAIRKLLNKEKYKSMLKDKMSKNKVIASMLRRGFKYEQITRCIDEIDI